MMQDGLHIGLAAWINQQRNTGSFAVYPALPIVTALVDLESIQDVNDLAKAAEFARLTNFVPRQGQIADTFSASAVLWQVHRDILGQMDHATEPWTSPEQAEYQAARDILYTTDASGRPTPSQKFLLYEEMKNAYRDLNNSGGSSDEIRQAMVDWMVRGHKQLIEDALEVIARLWNRSTLNQAQNEWALLEPMRLLSHGDMSFAPIYFAPISAIARETWMEARVSFADLDRAVGNSPASGKWRAYRANRAGEVLFDYVVVECIRPWYTPSLYEADDWKLSTNDTVVSKGNGTEGLLPAYVDAVYLVGVKNVTTKPKPSRPKPKPRPTLRPVSTVDIARAELFQPSLQPKSLGNANPRIGVVKKAVNTARAMRTASASSGSLPARQLSGTKTAIVTPSPSRFHALNLGQVRRVTAVDLNYRYSVAQAYLVGIPRPSPPSAEETIPTEIYVAGFGCEKIPFAPNPNVNYQW